MRASLQPVTAVKPPGTLFENTVTRSFRARSESRDVHGYWIPAFAGMTGKHRAPVLGDAPGLMLSCSRLWLCLLWVVLVMAGCAAVGPDYVPPAARVPEKWHTAPDPSVITGMEVIQKWWAVFNDPILTRLIGEAAAGNLDLKTAMARVKEARARIGVAAGVFYPQVDAVGEFARQRGSANTLVGIGAEANQVAMGLDSSWEIDLFGRIRRSVEAATADYQATLEDRRDVQVSLFAVTARTYLTVRTLQARLAATEGNIESQRQVLSLTQTRFKYGLAADLDVAQAEDVLANSEALVPTLRSALIQAINTIAVLLGRPPGAVHDELMPVKPIPIPPAELTVGLPVDLLRQRPDIRRAEREIAAQTARIGVATADLYPTFSLLGTIGLEATDVGDLFTSGSQFYTVGPTVRWNVFAGGRIRSRIKVEDARTEQALLRYEQTVLNALKEAENAMTAYLEERNRIDALERSVAAARRTLKLAIQLYKDGLRDFQNVLDAERNVFNVENQLAEAKGNIAISLVQIYRALGGGWEVGAGVDGAGEGPAAAQ